MNETRPIKRSVQLQPLSREHHDGLLFVWKLKQGIANKTNPELLKEFTNWYWKQHIRPHFFQEEKLLLPYMPAQHPLALQMKKEHDDIRELVLSIGNEPDNQDLARLASLVEAHIRFEEREFFQYLEQHLSVEQLNEINAKLEQHPVSCSEEWKNEFWIIKK